MKGLTILGSTGTIGMNTLDVVSRHRDRWRVVALTANRDVTRLAEQCIEWSPRYAAMADGDAAEKLAGVLKHAACETEVLAGGDALARVSALPGVDMVMAGIVGAAGLLPTLAAARAGKRVLLANKEALVMSGHLFMEAVEAHGARLLPIDSEHNAIFQCLPAGVAEGVGMRRILLTGSGGPFRTTPLTELEHVTPDEACAHPNWDMGRKISVDSATMMNKGLELIEACWLFAVTPGDVEVVIHPQSVIHSMVEYNDGSVLAQMGNPDMRTPIAHALAWPERVDSGVASLDLVATGRLDFKAADFSRFPCLRLGYEAARRGDTASTVLNAANEVAVEAFLQEQIGYLDIARVVESTLERQRLAIPTDLDVVLAIDAESRELARAEVVKCAAARGLAKA